MVKYPKSYQTGAAESFIETKLSQGIVSFSLADLIKKTGLSVIAARNQLLRLGEKVARVSPRQQYFLIVTPEHRSIGSPPVGWWLDDYFGWLGRPYYLAIQSAAGTYGSSQQAVQVTQVMTDIPRREIIIGRVRLHFFVKSGISNTITQQPPGAYAPLLVSTPESTAFDLVRYAHSIGGIERAAETIMPMLPLIKAKALKRVLDAENEIATSQRLGFVLEAIGANSLAKVVKNWLPMNIQMVPIATHADSNKESVPVSREWRVINNSMSFL